MAEPPRRPRKPQRKVKRTAFGTRLRAELRDYLAAQAASNGRSLSELARLRERASDLADQAAWVGNDAARIHLLDRAAKMLERLG